MGRMNYEEGEEGQLKTLADSDAKLFGVEEIYQNISLRS